MEIDLVQFPFLPEEYFKELTSTLSIAALAKVWRLGDEGKTHKLHRTKNKYKVCLPYLKNVLYLNLKRSCCIE